MAYVRTLIELEIQRESDVNPNRKTHLRQSGARLRNLHPEKSTQYFRRGPAGIAVVDLPVVLSGARQALSRKVPFKAGKRARLLVIGSAMPSFLKERRRRADLNR